MRNVQIIIRYKSIIIESFSLLWYTVFYLTVVKTAFYRLWLMKNFVLFDFNSLVQITVIVATSYIVIVYGDIKKIWYSLKIASII